MEHKMTDDEYKFNCPHCGKSIKSSVEYKEKLALDYDEISHTTTSYPDYELIITFEKR